MHKNYKALFCLIAAFAAASSAPAIRAQMSGGSSGGSTPGGSSSAGAAGTTASPGFTDKSDLIGAIAPPFDLEDVFRMHRVGIQDEAIVNALRSRYHPLELKDGERKALRDAGVSDRLIAALEDPYGIGIENVRENVKAADAVAPPVARTAKQAAAVEPNRPVLKARPAPEKPDVPTPGGQVYVGQSNPPEDTVQTVGAPSSSAPHNEAPTAANTNHGGASLDIAHAFVTSVPPQPVTKVVSKPLTAGIYLRRGPDWERVDEEPVYWHHHGDKEKDIEGSVLRPLSATQTYPGGSDFLIITSQETSAIQYELVRLKVDQDKRAFKPAPAGQVYNTGGGDLVHFDPQKIGQTSWLVSIHDVPPGEYGFLPPVTTQVHSTTNLATTLYTFRVK